MRGRLGMPEIVDAEETVAVPGSEIAGHPLTPPLTLVGERCMIAVA